jgi:hypothetical protein
MCTVRAHFAYLIASDLMRPVSSTNRFLTGKGIKDRMKKKSRCKPTTDGTHNITILGAQRTYPYLPEATVYAVLFSDIISINY